MPADQEDYYGGMSDSMQGESSDDAPEKEGDEGEESALISKSMFGNHDPKVGEEYVFKVDRLLENEVQISYAPAKGKGDESSMKGSMDSMDEMASETSDGGY